MPHIHEKIDFIVDVFIVHEDKVLLRLHEKYNKWLSVGGHIELDEDPNQAALREVKEEVGLDVILVHDTETVNLNTADCKQLIPPKFLNIHKINDEHQHIGLVYFATSKTDKVIPETPDDKWKWATKNDLETVDLLPHVKLYAEKALEQLEGN